MTAAVMSALMATVVLCVAVEVISAVLPLVLVIVLVRPEERRTLAEVLAAVDSSRRLRLWPALRAAVAARRCRLR